MMHEPPVLRERRQILHLMVEGNSIWGIARLADVSPVTVLRYLEQAGAACMAHHDRAVRGVKASRVECDEIWSFVHCKKAIWRRPRPRRKALATLGPGPRSMPTPS